MQHYLYLNAVLYLGFAVWCTFLPGPTATSLGYLALSNGGRSEYLVIYGGLQAGLGIMFWLLARNPATLSIGIVISIAIYGPLVLCRLVSLLKHWPVGPVTLATGALETLLLVAALWLYVVRSV